MTSMDLTAANIAKWIDDLGRGSIESDPFKPQNFGDFVGQTKAKKVASIIIEAAKKDQRPLPNVLITGSFGQGKTSLARLMADAFDPSITLVDAVSINKEVPKKGTFIVDEIHNLSSDVCDSLNITIDDNKIHLIGCSTNPGQLPAAFRSRFRQIYLEPYTVNNIADIIARVLIRKQISASANVLKEIATRSRYNPRVALNYLAFILDLATLKSTSTITLPILTEAFSELGVDKYGFLARDEEYIKAIPEDGRAVGLQYISAITSIDEKTIETEVEPFLMKMGLIDRTPRGRVRVPAIIKKYA